MIECSAGKIDNAKFHGPCYPVDSDGRGSSPSCMQIADSGILTKGHSCIHVTGDSQFGRWEGGGQEGLGGLLMSPTLPTCVTRPV